MKVDGGVGWDLDKVGAEAKALEELGYSGIMTAETSHDPFFPLVVAAMNTQRIELMTSIAVAFARTPMILANIGHDLNAVSKGRFVLGIGSQIRPHIAKRFSMPWSAPAARDARVHPRDARHLGDVARRQAAGIRRQVLHAYVDDAVLHADQQRIRRAEGISRRGRSADDGSRRRSGGRRDHSRVHDGEIPARDDAAGFGEGLRARGQITQGFRDQLSGVRRYRQGRQGDRGSQGRDAPPDRVLRIDAGVQAGARLDRRRRSAKRPQQHVEAGPLGRDGPARSPTTSSRNLRWLDRRRRSRARSSRATAISSTGPRRRTRTFRAKTARRSSAN